MSTLFEELSWRGFINQSTFSDPSELDKKKFNFYWGVDPSSSSMTVGNLAMAMMVKHFINYGHHPFLLVGGATGMIGDPDGKREERKIMSKEDIEKNKQSILKQYKQLFKGSEFKLVDNLDWFKDYTYLDFLRDIGKHVPLSQMLGREFVQSRLENENSGISYAEFSYVMIQAYDFLYLHRKYGVDMQVCGSDQWGNSVAGVDLIRRLDGDVTHVWAGPLIVNPKTNVKFGKSEAGAVWLNPEMTTPTVFYQFWVNSDDEAVEHYLKIFTMLSKEEIQSVMQQQSKQRKDRPAQFKLASEVTKLVHGAVATDLAERVTAFLVGKTDIAKAKEADLSALRREVPSLKSSVEGSIVGALVTSGLASSNTAARQLISSGSIYINNAKLSNRENFNARDFTLGRLLLRRGKAFKDSALVELAGS